MIDCILGFFIPGPFEFFFIVVTFVIPFILLAILLWLFLRNRKENIRLRLEVGKLANEIEKERKQKSAE